MFPGGRKAGRKVNRGGRFSNAAFLVGYCKCSPQLGAHSLKLTTDLAIFG